jgi:hypothetical protein
MHGAVRAVLVVGTGALLAFGALGAEPLVRDVRWPLAPIDSVGGMFTVRTGGDVDLDAAAASAQASLPDHAVAVAYWGAEPMLFVARLGGDTIPEELRAWRDRSGFELAGPELASFGGSGPDWFAAPRRDHDAAFAAAAMLVSAAIVLPVTRRRRSPAGG